MSNDKPLLKCAKAPCKTCPYRKDVASGVWDASEYKKLAAYDGTIVEQLTNGGRPRFDCHQSDGNLCAGWVGCHGPENLVALRLQSERIDPSVWDYATPVPLFASGAEAAAHGMKKIKRPDAKARRAIAVLQRKREREARTLRGTRKS
jgi:hypothetical protein